MSLRTSGLSVEIAVSNMCLPPINLPGRPSWGSNLEELVPFLEQTGYCNYEIHPTKTLVEDIHARRLSGDAARIALADTVVGSLHQTFNEGTGLYGVAADIRNVQRTWASIGGMRVIQHALSRPVPSVHYAGLRTAHIPASPISELPGYPGSFPVIQPKPEIYRHFRLRDPKKLVDAVGSVGMVGTCEDTVHSRETAKDGTPSPPWEDIWPWRFASGGVYQVHVSADRADIAKQDPELAAISHQEFRAFTSGTWRDVINTEMSKMIIQAIENWVPPPTLLRAVGAPVLRMVTETPPWLRSLPHHVRDHARFADTLTELILEAGAKPLRWGDTAPSVSSRV